MQKGGIDAIIEGSADIKGEKPLLILIYGDSIILAGETTNWIVDK